MQFINSQLKELIHYTDIIEALRGKRFVLDNEKALQADIASFLAARFPGLLVAREFTLDSRSIIDFLIDNNIGMEIKIKGSKREIYRQCERYCDFDLIKTFILVTNLSMGFPEKINGKSCYVVKLGTAWL